jgi:hypothetical protein
MRTDVFLNDRTKVRPPVLVKIDRNQDFIGPDGREGMVRMGKGIKFNPRTGFISNNPPWS